MTHLCLQAAHGEEVIGLKKQAAEEQEKQDKALADLRSDLEQQVTKKAEELARNCGELMAAVANADELETAIEVLVPAAYHALCWQVW